VKKIVKNKFIYSLSMTHVYQYLETVEDFYQMRTTSERCIIIYSASWCGPCKLLKTWLDRTYPDFQYPIGIVDVENSEMEELCTEVTGLPTIEFIKDSEKEKEIVGFDKVGIQEMMDQMLEKEDIPEGVSKISMEDMF